MQGLAQLVTAGGINRALDSTVQPHPHASQPCQSAVYPHHMHSRLLCPWHHCSHRTAPYIAPSLTWLMFSVLMPRGSARPLWGCSSRLLTAWAASAPSGSSATSGRPAVYHSKDQ